MSLQIAYLFSDSSLGPFAFIALYDGGAGGALES